MSDLKQINDMAIYTEAAHRSAAKAAKLARENADLNNKVLRLTHEVEAKKAQIASQDKKIKELLGVCHA